MALVEDEFLRYHGNPEDVWVAFAELVACRPAWQARAACRGQDPNVFFPGRGESTDPAKAICAGCVAREPCLVYALEHGDKFGVFGGLSERERRRVRRRRTSEVPS